MRKFLTFQAIALLAISAVNDDKNVALIADAQKAAVTNPYEVSIQDNYGNPEDFVKYIIRRPPAIA